MFYTDNGNVYTVEEADEFIKEVIENGIDWVYKWKKKGSFYVANVPCAFDTETTSVEINGQKFAFMYIWQFGINGICIYGRTWGEYQIFIHKLAKALNLNGYRRLYCYVHNLGFDYQFFRKYFLWRDVFAIDDRTPIYARGVNGIEYRCSYMLTAESLDETAKHLTKYKVAKLVGNLNYDKIRTSITPLTKKELKYCLNDIRVIMCHIQEQIEAEKYIYRIPHTKTGYVRRDVRKAVLKDKGTTKLIQNLKLSREEYELFKEAFQGGFTHANAYWSGVEMDDVVSYDFTSSYPTVMLSEMYPMSNGTKLDPDKLEYEDFMELIRTKCCLMKIHFNDIELKEESPDCPLSSSKCTNIEGAVIDNGRIRRAKGLTTTITEVDYITIKQFYKSESMEILDMWVYDKGYLPKPIIEKVLEYYEKKTTLKDVEEFAGEYMLMKGMLNSIYGMMVMNIVRALIAYDEENGWSHKENDDINGTLEKYNEDENRFNWYPWGVYITAYARRNLFTGIAECGFDYIYSDTDSIKIIHAKDHEDYILTYNRLVTEKLEACLDHYDLDKSKLAPLTVKGKKKPLGVWDFDGHYKRFKTLGAKRYMVEYDEETMKKKREQAEKDRKEGKKVKKVLNIGTTIAGVGKESGAKYFSKFKDPFEAFTDHAEIPAKSTGKMTHTYIDDDLSFEVTDYLGNTQTVRSKSGVHLSKSKFSMKLSPEYTELLRYLHFGSRDDICRD